LTCRAKAASRKGRAAIRSTMRRGAWAKSAAPSARPAGAGPDAAGSPAQSPPPELGPQAGEAEREDGVELGLGQVADRSSEGALVGGAVRLGQGALEAQAAFAEAGRRRKREVIRHPRVEMAVPAGIGVDPRHLRHGEIDLTAARGLAVETARFVVDDPVPQRATDRVQVGRGKMIPVFGKVVVARRLLVGEHRLRHDGSLATAGPPRQGARGPDGRPTDGGRGGRHDEAATPQDGNGAPGRARAGDADPPCGSARDPGPPRG
jgi:hypothetical protein